MKSSAYQEHKSRSLPDKASIFTAEIEALASALRYIKVSESNKFVIFCLNLHYKHCCLSVFTHLRYLF